MRVEHPMSSREQALSRALKALAEQQGAVSPCASAFVLQALQPGLSIYRLLRCLADQYSPPQDLQEASACVARKKVPGPAPNGRGPESKRPDILRVASDQSAQDSSQEAIAVDYRNIPRIRALVSKALLERGALESQLQSQLTIPESLVWNASLPVIAPFGWK